MDEREAVIDGVRVPRFLYGTAWKEDETERLVALALRRGFRGFDTANQRKHYHEAGVGNAIRTAVESGLVSRDDLFLQTKFTFLRGQDHRLPYDPDAEVAEQVEQSIASSSSTSERRSSIPTCSTVSQGRKGCRLPIGRPGERWRRSTIAVRFASSVRATFDRPNREAVRRGAPPTALRPKSVLCRPGLGS